MQRRVVGVSHDLPGRRKEGFEPAGRFVQLAGSQKRAAEVDFSLDRLDRARAVAACAYVGRFAERRDGRGAVALTLMKGPRGGEVRRQFGVIRADAAPRRLD